MEDRPEPRVETFTASGPSTRLDRILAARYTDLSRSRLQRLIEEGNVLVNGHPVQRSGHRTVSTDSITVTIPPSVCETPQPERIPVEIVYENADVIVVNKPAGLTVHPAPGHAQHTLVNAMLAHSPELALFSDTMRPGIVHRLDKDTSGLMLIARNEAARQNLIEQFKAHSIQKGYLALVKGKVEPERGIIEAPIGRDPAHRKRMAVVSTGKEATTSFRVKEHLGGYTLLDISIETGRTHQIRVHLAAIGFPVAGDRVYGIKAGFLARQFLHAWRLGFRLPAGGLYREFTCALPEDLQSALDYLH